MIHPDAELYEECYRNPAYAMKAWRQENLAEFLATMEPGTFLDVGCGRGESIEIAKSLGWTARGCEIARTLCGPEVDFLPKGAVEIPYDDASIDLVSSLDVLEHLQPSELLPSVRELCRVGRSVLLGIPHHLDGGRLHRIVQGRKEWSEELSKVAEFEIWKTLRVGKKSHHYTYFVKR